MRYLLSHAKGWVERLQTLSLFAAATGILLGIPVSGCSSDLQRKGAQEVRIGAFESSDATVDTPGAVDAAADAEGKTVVIEREEAMSSGTRGMKSTQRIIETDGQIDSEVDVFEMRAPVGDRYTIDGLVGQINGRPIYADEFLIPIADRIMRIASDPNIPRPTAIAEVEKLVALRFNDVVDSELIVAEAESSLSPEMQQGIFGWLQSIQEQTIAERGGTRATAEASIGEEFQISLDEFLEERRTVALAMNLLRKRIEPRAIVSWRDVEQEYRRRGANTTLRHSCGSVGSASARPVRLSRSKRPRRSSLKAAHSRMLLRNSISPTMASGLKWNVHRMESRARSLLLRSRIVSKIFRRACPAFLLSKRHS